MIFVSVCIHFLVLLRPMMAQPWGRNYSSFNIHIHKSMYWLWLEILLDLCEWYTNEDVPHKAPPNRWDLYSSLHDFRHCSEVSFRAVKNAQQISLPWHSPACVHSDVAQREPDSAWILRSLRMSFVLKRREPPKQWRKFAPQNSRTSVTADSSE
jgi:hypothetical protein